MSIVRTDKMDSTELREYNLKKSINVSFFAKVMEMITVQKLKDKIIRKYDGDLCGYLFDGIDVNDHSMELAIKKLQEIFFDPKNVHESGMPVLLFNMIIDSINKSYPKLVGTSTVQVLKKDVKEFHDEIMLERAEEKAMREAEKKQKESEPDPDSDWPEDEWPTVEEMEGPIWDDDSPDL